MTTRFSDPFIAFRDAMYSFRGDFLGILEPDRQYVVSRTRRYWIARRPKRNYDVLA